MVTDNGGRRKLTKRQAIIKQVVNQSTKGDWPAIKILLGLVREIEDQSDPASPETSSFTAPDEKIIEQLRAQFSGAYT